MTRKFRLPPVVGMVTLVFFLQTSTCVAVEYWIRFFANNLVNTLPDTNTPTPVPTQDSSAQIVLPPSINCEDVRLTSPLGGLPNGIVTFYWDAIPNADTVQINLHGENLNNASFSAPGTATNLTADVSSNAIGGVFLMDIEIVARDANGNTCSQRYATQREAPPQEPPIAQETPEPQETPACVGTPTPGCF